MSAIFGTLAGKIVGGGVVLALIGGALLYWNISTFNRGYAKGWAENTEAQKKAIAIKTKIAEENKDKWRDKTPGEKTAELQKRCVAACQQEPQCEKACRN